MQSINRPKTTLSLFLAIGTLILSAQPRTIAAAELLNAVVAIVFDTPITFDDIKIQTAPLEEELFRQFGREPAILQQKINELRQSALENLIDRELIINEFQSAGYAIPESVIDEQVQDRIRRQFGDRLTLTKTIQARGITYEAYRKGIRQQVIVDALTARNVNSVLLVSPFEIERYYQANLETFQQEERIRLRMIFLRHDSIDKVKAPKLLGEIRNKISEGASFADMASVYHDGSQRESGGDWGWVEKSVLREDLAEAAFALKENGLSDVLEREEGCYLMFVEEHRNAEPRALSDVRADIEKTLLAEERNRLQKQWIGTLRKKGYIRYY
ncbi:peptidyl-prolyl cis-trans isomerase [Verrucomicrobia bacterium]|jgi:peptidyl-prolyl cis-trans isomerase SurA|nr:hypothetical protein [Verrucomicrobiota bacterium]MDA7866790.1 peptidyl-prolyl cis-trans isomerase [Verrucomicrobiota bacterium]